MEIKKPAMAGTLESSDVQITVEPASTLTIDIKSSVINQFGKQIKKVVTETLARLEVSSGHVIVVDKGALDGTIMARVECAIFRAAEHTGKVPWGEMGK